MNNKRNPRKNKQSHTAISLFTGAGGMDIGFVNAGFKILWANDSDLDACKSYQANHSSKIVYGDINDYVNSLKIFKDVDCIFGGPPCQGFSVAGKMNLNDPRNQLVDTFMTAVEIASPRSFVMENVKSLATLSKFNFIKSNLIKRAVKIGYHTEILILDASEYGVPQKRERMFLFGFKEKTYKESLSYYFNAFKTKSPLVRDILLKLGVAGSFGNARICNAKVTLATKPVIRKSPYAGMLFNGQGRPINPHGYAPTLAATMGGNRTPIVDEQHCYLGKQSWVEKYHKYLIDGGLPYPSNATPPYLRRLTIDEVIALQTFPKDYVLTGKQTSLYRQLGNAVPCKLAEVVAKVTKLVLNESMANIDCVNVSELSELRF